MASLFKSRITVEDAATALSVVTHQIGTTYLDNVFPGVTLPNSETVKSEVRFLSIYIIDGLIKEVAEESWRLHREILGKSFYLKCAELASISDPWKFASMLLDRLQFYNAGVSGLVMALADVQGDDRLVAVGGRIGELFAEYCGSPQDNLYMQIGGGVFMTVKLSSDRLFFQLRLVE